MLPIRRRIVLASAAALVAFLGPLSLTSSRLVATELIPSQLSDEAFWNMVTEFSEPNGYFRADNFVSNETTFQYVIRELKKVTPGGVYLGVGPDQNFTYVVAMRPKIAIIFDIRRQNMLQHLMYKALIEMSSDRADFISRLFSRKRPEGLELNSSASQLFLMFENVPTDREFFLENLQAIKKQLEQRHGFKLSAEDEGILEYIYRAFFAGGPDLTYNGVGGGGFGRGRMPSYADLMQMTDGEGQNRSYLGSEENFKILQDLENKNLIVPIVADFAGPKAIRAVAAYLKDHDAHVTAFYVSNVEQYLFQQNDDWSKFYRNVQLLPVDATSTFIRSVFNGITVNYQANGFMRSASVLSSIPGLIEAFDSGELKTYYDVIQMSK
ncbi:MAG: hypothetical protein DMG16_23430 [Acidobacteria bacterium]|nr:MAG: hypothetical protein DMG16_23430 [Acidobacteriota bacterium]